MLFQCCANSNKLKIGRLPLTMRLLKDGKKMCRNWARVKEPEEPSRDISKDRKSNNKINIEGLAKWFWPRAEKTKRSTRREQIWMKDTKNQIRQNNQICCI